MRYGGGMKSIFIDGSAGTTGLRIYDRIEKRKDVCLIKLPEEKRKDLAARAEALNDCDVAFLCLPDDASRQAVGMVKNPDVTVIDTSTAHRTSKEFAYGFPELDESFFNKIASSKRIAVPGCHASGFIALVYPLIKAGVLSKDALLTCHSVTGYSGGGKKMISQYEDKSREVFLDAPRQYGLLQNHKHLAEMVKITGIENAPVFCPIVSDYYSGMTVTVPLFKKDISCSATELKEIYKAAYPAGLVKYEESIDENGFISACALSGRDDMQISVLGNEERILLIARYDNLGKGASGAAVECMNIALKKEKTEGLIF